MIDRISSLFLVRCSISVAPIRFLRKSLSSKRNHRSIPDLNDRERKNTSCVLGMKMSDYDKLLMAESSIWWVVLNDIFISWSLRTFFHNIPSFIDGYEHFT